MRRHAPAPGELRIWLALYQRLRKAAEAPVALPSMAARSNQRALSSSRTWIFRRRRSRDAWTGRAVVEVGVRAAPPVGGGEPSQSSSSTMPDAGSRLGRGVKVPAGPAAENWQMPDALHRSSYRHPPDLEPISEVLSS